jgi:N-acetylmuramic acid 6-phosphate etherase
MKSKSPRATEQRNLRTRGLASKSTLVILRSIHREDARVPRAVGIALPAVARAVDAIVHAFENGGRLFYVGAGTSGRLATLDAAELPPTFGISPRLVQAVIAGGSRALTHAVERAEDDRTQGARDLAARILGTNDIVVGITASGTTSYVLGALEYARKRGAVTIGVTSNPGTPLSQLVRIPIVTPTGAEAITGSTRMKAGTAQKLVLNMISTAAMARIGRVYDNWMIGVALTNKKLQARGLRILSEATGCELSAAARALRAAKNDVPTALVILKRNVDANEARRLLRAAKYNVNAALLPQTRIPKGK